MSRGEYAKKDHYYYTAKGKPSKSTGGAFRIVRSGDRSFWTVEEVSAGGIKWTTLGTVKHRRTGERAIKHIGRDRRGG